MEENLNQQQLIFLVVLGISFLAAIYVLIFGPGGHIQKSRKREAKRLEVKITMGGGLELIDDFINLSKAYVKLGNLTEADTTMKKAVSLAENEYGRSSSKLIPVLNAYANLLVKMNRGIEAKNLKKRIKEIKDQ